MHIRARLQHRRLQISLVDTRRAGGKVRQQHIAALGSVSPKMTVADRLAFWDQVEERLAKLDNRMDKDGHAKIIAALRTKIPMPTPVEHRKAEANTEFTDAVAILLKAGWTIADINRAMSLSMLNDDEMAEVTALTLRGYERAQRAAFNKVYRRRRRAAP